MCHEVRTRQPPTEKLHQIMARTALFVNEHGRQSEIVLRVKQGDNPTFGFLMPDHHLHPYFQYLVDHPQVLKRGTDSPKEEEEKSDNHASEAGALSLLGSVYGNGDEDDATLKPAIKEKEPLNLSTNATVPVESEKREQPPSVGIVNKEETKLPFSAVAKEKKSSTVNKVFSGNVTAVVAGTKIGDGYSLTEEREQSFQDKTADLNPPIMEPPSFLKTTIEKIVEFIVRNGRQFEAILINQDKNTGRFPFLLSTNQYHSCYLKILDEAYELKLQGKNLFDHKSDEEHHSGSKKKAESHVKDAKINDLDLAEFSEGGYYDPQRKDKFKMILVGQKKDSQDQSSKAVKQSGLSADEAAAIVLAATRGASPGNSLLQKSADDVIHSSKNSGATVEEAAASVMAATRVWSPANLDDGRTSSLGSLQGTKSLSRFASNDISGTPASTGFSGSVATTSDVTVATVIAKSVALVASREADSSEAGLTKEQKLKAERLKRAKMFAALIKTGNNCTGELMPSATNRHGSMDPPAGGSMQIGSDSYSLGLEREGSSAPDREYGSRKMHHDDYDEDLKQSRKRHHSSRCNTDHSYKKSCSSFSGKEARHRHKPPHSSSEDEHDEHKHRRSSEHRRRRHRDHCHSSDDDDRELYEKSRRKHHSRTERKRESEIGDTRKSLEGSEGPSVCNMPASDDKHTSPSATEVPNDLRAKIRAMLLETL